MCPILWWGGSRAQRWRIQRSDGSRADGGREELDQGALPPEDRLGIQPRQTLQATQRGRVREY